MRLPLETLDLSLAEKIVGILGGLVVLAAALVAVVRFFFVPKLRELIQEVVEQEFKKREEGNAAIAQAEKTAIEQLATRIGTIEERMTKNEQDAAETKAAVERIEEATKRQTKTLDAIVEGIGEIKEGFVVQREKVARAEKDIEDLQQRPRRRSR